jgi:antitoxin (DNA-binding transcriptional repressor) of toxin-antitoxin stability system
VREIHHDFGRVLAWIENGEEVEITKNGRVVARMVPAKAELGKLNWPDLAARRTRTFPDGLKGKPVSEIVAEGRGDY